MVDCRDLLDVGVLDALSISGNLEDVAARAARQLQAQTAFSAVKTQVRGPLQAQLRELAETGEEPYLEAFGAA